MSNTLAKKSYQIGTTLDNGKTLQVHKLKLQAVQQSPSSKTATISCWKSFFCSHHVTGAASTVSRRIRWGRGRAMSPSVTQPANSLSFLAWLNSLCAYSSDSCNLPPGRQSSEALLDFIPAFISNQYKKFTWYKDLSMSCGKALSFSTTWPGQLILIARLCKLKFRIRLKWIPWIFREVRLHLGFCWAYAVTCQPKQSIIDGKILGQFGLVEVGAGSGKDQLHLLVRLGDQVRTVLSDLLSGQIRNIPEEAAMKR